MLDPKQLPSAGETSIKKPTSQAKSDANRHNSRKSTGPKTPRDKKNSSRNARKHGLLTKDLVITPGAGKENQADFGQLLAKLREIYPPVDIEIDLLVRELAGCIWKDAPALRAEKGVITLNSEIPYQKTELSDLEVSCLATLSMVRPALC